MRANEQPVLAVGKGQSVIRVSRFSAIKIDLISLQHLQVCPDSARTLSNQITLTFSGSNCGISGKVNTRTERHAKESRERPKNRQILPKWMIWEDPIGQTKDNHSVLFSQSESVMCVAR
jgi:hypothetical protein